MKRLKESRKNLQEIKKILFNHRRELTEKYKIKKIKIFGSYAEGRQKETSDIDLIVEFEKVPTYIKLVQIEERLSELLGVKVDLLTEESISPYIKPYIKEIEVL